MEKAIYKQTFGELKLFQQMAARVPAYGTFLSQHNIDASKITRQSHLRQVPITDKKNYLDHFNLSDLCWDGKIETNSYIVNSSGSTGVPYFWPRTDDSTAASNAIYELLFSQVFKLTGSTLLVNAFAQGSWIAGGEAFLAGLAIARDQPVTTINSGIDASLIVRQLKALASQYDNIVFTSYPPFLKDLFDVLAAERVLGANQKTYAVVGGEAISETWREYASTLLKLNAPTSIVSIYGMSDGGGILATETAATIALRQQLFAKAVPTGGLDYADDFGGRENTALFQYNPRLRHFSQGPDGQLLIHVKHGLPLFNYDTKDRGGVVAASMLAANKPSELATEPSALPFVYLLGRSDYAVTFYGLNIFPEHLRAVIDSMDNTHLTGRFVAQKHYDDELSQRLHIAVEAAESLVHDTAEDIAAKCQAIAEYIMQMLPHYNLEYAKLASSIGQQALPMVTLHEPGSIGYVTGRKHQWVKRD